MGAWQRPLHRPVRRRAGAHFISQGRAGHHPSSLPPPPPPPPLSWPGSICFAFLALPVVCCRFLLHQHHRQAVAVACLVRQPRGRVAASSRHSFICCSSPRRSLRLYSGPAHPTHSLTQDRPASFLQPASVQSFPVAPPRSQTQSIVKEARRLPLLCVRNNPEPAFDSIARGVSLPSSLSLPPVRTLQVTGMPNAHKRILHCTQLSLNTGEAQQRAQ